jgi:hypothetical protein
MPTDVDAPSVASFLAKEHEAAAAPTGADAEADAEADAGVDVGADAGGDAGADAGADAETEQKRAAGAFSVTRAERRRLRKGRKYRKRRHAEEVQKKEASSPIRGFVDEILGEDIIWSAMPRLHLPPCLSPKDDAAVVDHPGGDSEKANVRAASASPLWKRAPWAKKSTASRGAFLESPSCFISTILPMRAGKLTSAAELLLTPMESHHRDSLIVPTQNTPARL